jgi:hypothetical protein
MKTPLLRLALLVSNLSLFAPGAFGSGFEAHEWGTFTSVQGADGKTIRWNPLLATDLPDFVYDRSRPRGPQQEWLRLFGPFGKGSHSALQRMETPVIYFYSDQARTVDVTVLFPQGIVTEWYPAISGMGQTNLGGVPEGPPVKFVRWDHLNIVPRASQPDLAGKLPRGSKSSHYYAARNVDADFVQSRTGIFGGTTAETEQFVFYRGIGDFASPVEVSMPNEGALRLRGSGVSGIGHYFVVQTRNGRAGFHELRGGCEGGGQLVEVAVPAPDRPMAEVLRELESRMATALADAGLLPKEASAMVQTWKDSWFEETGLRVLYLLPQAWIDKTLPLEIKPAPSRVARVFVGRAEMLLPDIERRLAQQIRRMGNPDPLINSEAVEKARALELGRFTRVAIERLNAGTQDKRFHQQANQLLTALSQSSVQAPKLGAR